MDEWNDGVTVRQCRESCRIEVMHSTVRHKGIFILYARPSSTKETHCRQTEQQTEISTHSACLTEIKRERERERERDNRDIMEGGGGSGTQIAQKNISFVNFNFFYFSPREIWV